MIEMNVDYLFSMINFILILKGVILPQDIYPERLEVTSWFVVSNFFSSIFSSELVCFLQMKK